MNWLIGERVPEFRDGGLRRSLYFLVPGTETGQDFRWPFVDGLENDSITFAANHDLSEAIRETTTLGKPDCLTSPVVEQFGALGDHTISIDVSLL